MKDGTSRALRAAVPADRAELIAEAGSAAYIAFIAAVAQFTGLSFVLFPELGALGFDVLRRPQGTWAQAPRMLVATPIATGLLGIIVSRSLPYGIPSILLVVAGAVSLILIMRSPIAPGISAALLPLTLGIRSWWYPPALLVGLGTLAAISALRSHLLGAPADARSTTDRIDDLVEAPPSGIRWALPYALFLIAAAALAQTSRLHLILFPPLAVIGYEMYAHPRECPWAPRPLALVLACTGSAAAGAALVHLFGPGALAAACAIFIGTVLLRALSLHVPPALAVGLLPFVTGQATATFPLAVAAGTGTLVISFSAWRNVEQMLGRGKLRQAGRRRSDKPQAFRAERRDQENSSKTASHSHHSSGGSEA